MNIEKIKNAKTKYIGKNIEYFEEIDSTQEEAKRNIKKYDNGTIIIADKQIKGKGTHGRIWYTNLDNIAMTIIIKPKLKVKQLEGFTTSIAKNIQMAIKDLYNLDLEIKLPNDLLLNDKKICGILTEITTIKEEVKEIFIGIGFNVNEKNFPIEVLKIATSLSKETNKNYDREDIICKIIENLEEEIEKIKNLN